MNICFLDWTEKDNKIMLSNYWIQTTGCTRDGSSVSCLVWDSSLQEALVVQTVPGEGTTVRVTGALLTTL